MVATLIPRPDVVAQTERDNRDIVHSYLVYEDDYGNMIGYVTSPITALCGFQPDYVPMNDEEPGDVACPFCEDLR